MDPARVLGEVDSLKREVRIAALLVCQSDDEAATKPHRLTAADVAGLPDE